MKSELLIHGKHFHASRDHSFTFIFDIIFTLFIAGNLIRLSLQKITHTMKVGDSVKLKKNVKNEYIYDGKGNNIGGFEGRIFDIHKSTGIVFIQIEFDSISLKQMPDAYIKKLIKEDTDYACIDLYPKDVILSTARDTPEAVILARKEIATTHNFVSIIDDGDFDIWDKDPKDIKDSDEIALEPAEEGDELKVIVALCRVKGFIKQYNLFKKRHAITRKRTRKKKL